MRRRAHAGVRPTPSTREFQLRTLCLAKRKRDPAARARRAAAPATFGPAFAPDHHRMSLVMYSKTSEHDGFVRRRAARTPRPARPEVSLQRDKWIWRRFSTGLAAHLLLDADGVDGGRSLGDDGGAAGGAHGALRDARGEGNLAGLGKSSHVSGV